MNTRRNTLRLGMGLALSAIATAAALLAAPAVAQGADAWPSRPIKLIVPYAAGGFADTRARKIADKIGQSLGQPIVIDNRGGAGGVTGTDAIAKATDGHTFGFGSPGPLVTNPMLMKKLPYNAARDLQPIILIEEAPLILTTAPNQPFKTVAELVAAAKAKPGTLTYGSSGVGGAHHLSGELLAFQTRTEMVHVPYKGGALAATDLMGGHLAFMFEMGYAALPAIQGDKVKALAVSSKQRLKVLPGVPTLDEAGIKGFESYNWLGMIAPASTPPAVIERLNKAVNEALKDAEVRAMIENTGGMVMGGTPQAYGNFIEAERAKWGPVIKNANITLD
ncbi:MULTISPECIES: Bug family tripartite tricarboxylate transporter substrate binding protein [unclassified Delftia]|uniref:Bug family tripartite tricarboxylate transporter substrate binding protein n=1 Tax=unclassified Delftia TaxID=2613839 RepID=UPI0006486687|nr:MULTISPECIES: tripartite tricarboxylate transporter substrate binding protein [unclassified Delftia]MDC2858871.1 tripartite tricarboxylate transporter substrate binding protein [Delftia sp. DT-2]